MIEFLILSIAELAVAELAKGHGTNSTYIWGDLEDAVLTLTDNVVSEGFLDYHNFMNVFFAFRL